MSSRTKPAKDRYANLPIYLVVADMNALAKSADEQGRKDIGDSWRAAAKKLKKEHDEHTRIKTPGDKG